MSDSLLAKTKHDISVGIDRIGLDFIRRDERKNSLLLTVNSCLSAACLALLSEKEERDGLLQWIGVDPETSDDVLVDCFKCLVELCTLSTRPDVLILTVGNS